MQQHLMQQMQQQQQQQPMMAAYYPNNVTTDHIQQYLDENKSLILKIVESQNSGKLNECAENQARLQRNLMYLAAIADSQPQPPSMQTQYQSGGMLQPGAQYIPHQQTQQMTPQSMLAARSSMMYAQQSFSVLQQQQQQLQGQMGMGCGGSPGFHLMQADAGGSSLGHGGLPDFIRGGGGGSKQHMESSPGSSEGRGGGEAMYLKSSDE